VAKQSLKSLQADALNEGFLNDLGNDKTNYADKRQAPVTERLLIEVVGNFLLQVQENLIKANKIDTGTLSESVSSGDLVNNKGVYSIEAGYPLNSEAANYAPFVNQGVKGFISGNPSDSPFSFKSARPKYDGVMVDAMLQWVKRNGISSRSEDQRSNLSRLQSKRQSVGNIDVQRQTAYQIATAIKKRGLPKTDFFTSAVRQYFGDEFVAAVGSAFLSDVRVYIKQANALINSENK
jgi:hypothetical protein